MTAWIRRLDLIEQTLTRPLRERALLATLRNVEVLNERSVEYAFVFSKLAARGTGTILDVGTGRSPFPALAELSGWRVLAVDNVTDYWPRGRLGIRWGLFNPYFHVRKVDILREKVGTFDIVTCISTFEHVTNRRGLFCSMAEALNPGGALLLTTPYREQGGVPNAYDLPNSDAYGLKLPYGCAVMDRNELDALARSTGLEIADIQYWRFYEGAFWSQGAQLSHGVRVDRESDHQIACIELQART